MLSGQSETILSKNHTTSSSFTNVQVYWSVTQMNSWSAWYASNIGLTDGTPVTIMYAVRPVIMIGPDVQILGGNGTFNSPYQI